MTTLLQELNSKVYSLEKNERAELAHNLIASLTTDSEDEVEMAWNREIKDRVQSIKAGAVTGRDAQTIFAEIRATYL